ncbi:uncharacterized protein LOC136764527 [Amia ocellicauda]|uniref:uncharacterized protein LOC136764527 n=1 Tax=Amia ocellicauda TaxID=2972642 RepID=UPI0034639739
MESMSESGSATLDYSTVTFQSQLTSIMEILVRSAVSDISKLVEGNVTGLQAEVAQSKRENESLSWRLWLYESQTKEQQGAGATGTGRVVPPQNSRSIGVQVDKENTVVEPRGAAGGTRERETPVTETENPLEEGWCSSLWKAKEPTSVNIEVEVTELYPVHFAEEATEPVSVTIKQESVELEELRSESLRIKLERTDEDMDKSDLHGELIMGVQRPIEPSTLPDSRAPIVEELASSLRQDAEPTATEARKELTEQHRRSQRVEEDLSRLNSIDLAQSGPAYCTQICRLPVSDQGTEQLNLVPENSSKRFNSPRRGSNKKHIKNKQNRLSTANLLKQDLGHLWSHIVDSHAEHQADQTEKESTDDSQIEPCSGSVDTNPEVNKNQKPNLQSKCNQGEDVVPDCIQQGWRLESGEQRHGQRLEKTSQREMVKTLRSYTVTVESSSLQARQTKQQQLQQKQQKTKKQQQQQQSLPSSTIPPAPANEHAIDSDGKNQGHMLCPQQEEDSTATATAEVAAGKHHTPQRTPVRKRLHSCDQCGKGFREPERLDEHRPSCTGKKPYHCWQCGKSFLHPSKLKAHKHVHAGQRRHCCTHCGKNFTRASTLKTHQHIHTGARPYKCPQCGKTFNQSGALHSHLQTHSGDRPYTCKDCGKSFGKEINLKRHQLTHTGEKPHACDQCGKSFSQAGDLKTHQRIHTGEKPYSCKQCGKSFIQSSQLLKHQRIHTGEKLYKCPVCKKCFLQSGHLKSHQKSHTEERPFSCDECGKKYKNSRSLRFHKQVHTGERPHGCPQCGMNFFRSDTLKIHQRIHTGEKPYQCKRCGRRFNELGNLKRHRRCHTANKP